MLFKIRLGIAIIVLLLAILGMVGIFYPVHIFDIQFAPLLQRVLTDFSVIALVLFIVLVITTLLVGRIYCSLICPLGILQEIITLISGRDNEKQPNYPVKYFIMALTFGALIGGSTLLIRYMEPYTFFGSALTLSIVGLVAIVAIGLIAFFKNRFFCTDICPVGAVLGLLSKISLFKLYIDKDECLSCGMCERSCPSGCIDSAEQEIENETCVKCFKCVGKCPKDAIKFGIKPKEYVSFNQNRRSFITATAAVIALGAMVKAGIEISKNTAKKLKNIILPAGAVSEKRMLNECLNCNLCVKACPNKIIKKADKDFGTVHIDYSEGEKFCKFDCNECAKVCPSGAIKKITLEEKQKTRIAMAVINEDKCSGCGVCNFECPVHAISKKEDGKSFIDASKCIGCGACKKACHFGAVYVFAVNEQKVL